MNKVNQHLKKSLKGKNIIVIILSLIVIIVNGLGFFDVLDIQIANNISIPILGVVCLINGITSIKENKIVAIFCILASIFIFGCTLSVFILKIV